MALLLTSYIRMQRGEKAVCLGLSDSNGQIKEVTVIPHHPHSGWYHLVISIQYLWQRLTFVRLFHNVCTAVPNLLYIAQLTVRDSSLSLSLFLLPPSLTVCLCLSFRDSSLSFSLSMSFAFSCPRSHYLFLSDCLSWCVCPCLGQPLHVFIRFHPIFPHTLFLPPSRQQWKQIFDMYLH